MITNLRLRHLVAVRRIGERNSTGYASPAEVAEELKRDKMIVGALMMRLRDIGWLENPYRGCYRLSDVGKKVLEETRA